MNPTLRLLIACCRYCYGSLDRSAVRTALDGQDAERLLTLARRHRVQGIAWKALRETGVALTDEVEQGFRRDVQRITGSGLRTAAESGRLHSAFASARIPLLFLKGQVLGRLAWGDPFLKDSVDIDLLVPDRMIGDAARLLGALGYEQSIPEPSVDPADWHRRRKESLWRGPHLAVDLHSRVADSRYLIPRITATNRSELIEIAPGMSLPTLRLPEQVAYLAVHGASSAWFRLKWLADFAAILHPLPAQGVANLRTQAVQLGAGRAIDQALLLAHRYFGTPLPEEVPVDTPTRWLVRMAEGQLLAEREPTRRPLGTATLHLSQLLLRPGSRFAIGEIGRQVGDILTR